MAKQIKKIEKIDGYNKIKWNGEIYNRKDGHIFYDNEWLPEGSKHFPWEKMPWE